MTKYKQTKDGETKKDRKRNKMRHAAGNKDENEEIFDKNRSN